jgi:uncharacterized membrane protein
VTVTTRPVYPRKPGPLHAILLAGIVPLFLGALLSDIAYYRSFQIQWSNFASWLIVGGLIFCGLTLLFSLVNVLRARHRKGRPLNYFVVLLVTWILGFINALEHAKDAWEVMPQGLILSAVVAVLALVAAWMGLSNLRSEVTK